MFCYCKLVYVIIGIKIVFGVEFQSVYQCCISSVFVIEVDGMIWSGGMVLVSGGLGIEVVVLRDQLVVWKGSSDFVFVYWVSRVIVIKKSGLVFKEEEYWKGVMFGNEVYEVEKVEFMIMQVQDYDVVEEGCEVFKVFEDGE